MPTIESVVTAFPKQFIDFILSTLGSDLRVVGSRLTEDGWELVLEGNPKHLSEVVYVLGMGNESQPV